MPSGAVAGACGVGGDEQRPPPSPGHRLSSWGVRPPFHQSAMSAEAAGDGGLIESPPGAKGGTSAKVTARTGAKAEAKSAGSSICKPAAGARTKASGQARTESGESTTNSKARAGTKANKPNRAVVSSKTQRKTKGIGSKSSKANPISRKRKDVPAGTTRKPVLKRRKSSDTPVQSSSHRAIMPISTLHGQGPRAQCARDSQKSRWMPKFQIF